MVVCPLWIMLIRRRVRLSIIKAEVPCWKGEINIPILWLQWSLVVGWEKSEKNVTFTANGSATLSDKGWKRLKATIKNERSVHDDTNSSKWFLPAMSAQAAAYCDKCPVYGFCPGVDTDCDSLEEAMLAEHKRSENGN